jgi:two-component system response regulator PilR (NtrC family)
METQSKLLRVIQEKEFMRLGAVDTIKVDVRLVAATNADLEELTRRGNFREDLFYRLNVITIELPPLRRRNEDIPLLARHFLSQYARENEKALHEISPAAMEMLMDYSWPGNVRELENVIERAVVLSTSKVLDVDLLSPAVREPRHLAPTPILPPEGLSFKETVSSFERQLILRALKSSNGVQKKAAELLRIKPTTLHEMMKRLRISTEADEHDG